MRWKEKNEDLFDVVQAKCVDAFEKDILECFPENEVSWVSFHQNAKCSSSNDWSQHTVTGRFYISYPCSLS